MIAKKANEVQVGEVVKGKIVEIVDVSKEVTILHFRDGVLPLQNTADVLVDVKVDVEDKTKK